MSAFRDDEPEFYRFERAARAAFEPAEPEDMAIGDCRDFLRIVFAEVGSPPHQWAVGSAHGEGKQERGSCTLIEEVDGAPLFIIGLPLRRRRKWAILHEAAHALTWDRDRDHDKVFAEYCVSLWLRFGDWPSAALLRLAADYGLWSSWPGLIKETEKRED